MMITLEGITGGKPFEPKSFPINNIGLTNGQQLQAVEDYPFFGLKEGDAFQIYWDGEYVRSGGLSWSVDQLIEEIRQGIWMLL